MVDEETMTPCRPGGRERLRPLIITAREHRDLDARFRRDMQALREAARRGPHPKETAHQCATRLFNQFEVLLARYERLFSFVRVPVARELLAEDLGTRDSAAYRRLLRARDRWLADGYGADRALLRAFAEPTFDAERARLTALIRTSRNHVKAAIRAMR